MDYKKFYEFYISIKTHRFFPKKGEIFILPQKLGEGEVIV